MIIDVENLNFIIMSQLEQKKSRILKGIKKFNFAPKGVKLKLKLINKQLKK